MGGEGGILGFLSQEQMAAIRRATLDVLESTGVRIQALCPGWVQTDLMEHPEIDTSHVPKRWRSKTEDVIDASLRALKRGKLIVIPGWRNKLLVLSVLTGYRPMVRWILRKVKFNQALPK